jgi:hypothetical protein
MLTPGDGHEPRDGRTKRLERRRDLGLDRGDARLHVRDHREMLAEQKPLMRLQLPLQRLHHGSPLVSRARMESIGQPLRLRLTGREPGQDRSTTAAHHFTQHRRELEVRRLQQLVDTLRVRRRLPHEGYGEIGPYFALSTSALDGWLDSYWDVGVDAGIGNTRWSSGDYRWALDLHAPRGEDWWTRLALAWEVLGRSEFTNLRQPSSISGPHVTSVGTVQRPFLGIDASRHDYVDTTLGVRVRVVGSMVLSLGVFKALNDQGVRPSGWSPVMSVEGTF